MVPLDNIITLDIGYVNLRLDMFVTYKEALYLLFTSQFLISGTNHVTAINVFSQWCLWL